MRAFYMRKKIMAVVYLPKKAKSRLPNVKIYEVKIAVLTSRAILKIYDAAKKGLSKRAEALKNL